ncbi:phage portal protein [Pokkaliibacter plantistimulans]|uniref:Phage portal protein n=1 Tax=Proteobacteria bacterium 228 TaxID=2083153 RepID=A0A2S5KT59_9PROT|nr:phage portal protein [Pokkaliibacter plantistimulans]PPC77930.1 phage portal protein [Pokkaliibacter plantistimulans]
MTVPSVQLLGPDGNPLKASAYQGAGVGFGGQLRGWAPSLRTADAALLPQLELGNARAEDVVRNNAFAANGVQLHIDNIVGHMFRLSYKPRWQRLGMTEEDARRFAKDVEQWWLEVAEDPIGCWLDVERKRTFTMMIRESIGVHTRLGEIMASVEWLTSRPAAAPLKTAFKLISPKRISNPMGLTNGERLAAGVEFNSYGEAIAYHVRDIDRSGYLGNGLGYTWKRVEKETRSGRPKFLHIFEPQEDGQTRGANQFLSVLEQMHMLPKLQHTKLQNAIVNAMYAAVIESEIDSSAAMELIGGGELNRLVQWMGMMADYHEGANIRMNGVKIPHLVPGERLNLQTSGNVDNGFVELESSILRWMSAGLNVPYEPFAKDYRQSSYSSARASMLEGWRYYMGRRKVIASRLATMMFGCALEEGIARKQITLPRSARFGFYDARAAWCNADWIGSGRLAIDGLKEVKEAVIRIEAGLSTYEKESALMGEDYQELFAQQVREAQERAAAGLPPPSWMATQAIAPDQEPAASEPG